jgi:hypothetical protein
MPTGTLVHIFPNKKLMVKISENTYDSLYNRLYNMSKQKNFPTQYIAVFTKENDDGEDEHFAKLTPDKYDKLNMPMFERLLRKEVGFTTRMKCYDFINDDNEQVCGINLELTSIRQIKPRVDEIDKMVAARLSKETELNAEEQAIDEDVEKAAAKYVAKKVQKDDLPMAPPVLERQMATAATHRRRRVEPSEESLAAADYQMPEEIKAFAVIDAFEQEE